MGRIIRRVREENKRLRSRSVCKNDLALIPNVKGDCVAVVKDIVHERGRGAPVAKLSVTRDNGVVKGFIVAPEGISVGQTISMGDNVELKVGNCTHLKNIPEGCYVSMVEKKPYDGGRYAKSCGTYAIVVFHNKDAHTTTIKLPSGEKVNVSADARAFIGIIAGGGKDDKPLLKAGAAYYKYKASGKVWPKTRGVAMNPVEHPHGGGNHQHIGHPSTISKHAPPNKRVGLVGARRTGRRKGGRGELK